MSDETPRRLAVALEYATGSREAPRVVAKGYGHVAEAIIELAGQNDVLIDGDPVLAEALSGVELDQTVPVELFEAVAEVIGFVLRARDRLL
jgi:FlhB-like protein